MSQPSHIPDDAELNQLAERLNVVEQPWRRAWGREYLRWMLAGQYRCDLEAYSLLKKCSAAKDMTEWNLYRSKNWDKGIYLQGADLSEGDYQGADFFHIHFEGADFRGARCEGATFKWAHCEGANFEGVHCERANFERAHCERANFRRAYCDRTRFYRADFNYKSNFMGCNIDENTDFRLTNIGNIRIEPGKRAMLERNIRRFNWQEWYGESTIPWQRAFQALSRLKAGMAWLDATRIGNVIIRKAPARLKEKVSQIFQPLAPALSWLRVAIVRLFWWISDYGYNTGRILKTFLSCILFFALVYTLFPGMLSIGATPLPEYSGFFGFIGHFCKMFCFATATMVTLGFGDINVAVGDDKTPNLLGMLVVVCNLAVGYFLLAVLVTRLAVLFQTMAPGYVSQKKASQEVYIEFMLELEKLKERDMDNLDKLKKEKTARFP